MHFKHYYCYTSVWSKYRVNFFDSSIQNIIYIYFILQIHQSSMALVHVLQNRRKMFTGLFKTNKCSFLIPGLLLFTLGLYIYRYSPSTDALFPRTVGEEERLVVIW